MKNKKIAAIVGCLIVQLCVGILYLWSIFRTDISKAYGGWEGVAMVASWMLFAFVVGNFIGGIINDHKGAKFAATTGVILFSAGIALSALITASTAGLFNITYCVCGGLGSGIAYGACISCVQKWLPHRKGLASGLAVSAFGLSTVIFTPVSKWLMDVNRDASSGLVNFKAVFGTLALVFFIAGIIGCILISLPNAEYLASLPKVENKAVMTVKRNIPLRESIKTVPFWFLFLSIFFINGTWNLTVPLIYDLGLERGLSTGMAALAVSITGIPNAAGRLIMATVSDKIGRTTSLIILAALTGVGAICMIFAGGGFYIFIVCLIAFAYGGPSAINAALSTDFFGPKYSGTNYGVIMSGLGFSSIFFNAVSKNILHGSIRPTFIMALVTAVITIFVVIVIARYAKHWND